MEYSKGQRKNLLILDFKFKIELPPLAPPYTSEKELKEVVKEVASYDLI